MPLIRELLNKAAHAFSRRRFDESLDEEIRLHIESRAEELIGEGATPRAAMAQARREFGSPARMSEDSRAAWRWSWIEDLLRDLRYGTRALRRDPGVAMTAVLSLALGIGVNTTIFSLAAEFLFSQPSVRDPGTLVRVELGGASHIPMREYRFVREAQVFGGLAGANEMQEVNWREAETSSRLFSTRVTGNYFDVAGIPVAIGRPIQDGDREAVVISHRFWKSRLRGKQAIIGQPLVLDGVSHTIVGVLPADHRTLIGFGYAPDLYAPIASESGSVSLYGRLPDGVTRTAALSRVKATAAQLDRTYPDGNRKWAAEVAVNGLIGIERLSGGLPRTISAFFAMLLAASGLLLLIACGNVASLLLARASTRAHEFAIRMSIGAGRGRIVRQMLAETLLLSILGAAAGLALNYGLTQFLNGLVVAAPYPLRMSIEPDARLLLYAALVAIGTALIAGLVPALRSVTAAATAVLKRDEGQVSGRRATLRNLMVAGQLAVSVVVLITAALSVRNLIESSRLDPGFEIRRTVWAQMRLVPESYPGPDKVRAQTARTLEELRATPGVESASVAVVVPLNDHFLSRTSNIYTDSSTQTIRTEYAWNAVGDDYFRTMGIGLIAGREFHPLDRQGARRVVIINESLARRTFGSADPVGRRIRFERDQRTERVIIAVARNSKYSTIGESDRPALYESYYQVGGRAMVNLLVRSGEPSDKAARTVNAALLRLDPSSAVEVKPMSRAMAFALLPSQIGAGLLGTMGSLGLALASVGLYGVLAYSISRRTREIGLRVALGARGGDVLRLVLREGAWILAIGLSIGIFLALLVTKPLARFLVPGLKAADPAAYTIVALVLIVVGCAASLRPALRALRVDPLTALRYE